MKTLAHLSSTQIIPSRSRFQLEHFVIGQHDTPEMRYRQILIEGADLTYRIRMAEIGIKKTLLEIEQLRATNDAMNELLAQEKELGLAYSRVALDGALYEYSVLEDLFSQYQNYTNEDIEANQPEYWRARLTRQAEIDVTQAREGISAGNLTSLIQAKIIDHNNKIEYPNELEK